MRTIALTGIALALVFLIADGSHASGHPDGPHLVRESATEPGRLLAFFVADDGAKPTTPDR